MSLRNLAERAGVSNPYLSQIERGVRKPSGEILKSIARALYIPTEALFERAGLLDEQGLSMSVETAVAVDRHLTAQQKQALMEIYRSFIGEEPKEET